jgi:hypothetical protein
MNGATVDRYSFDRYSFDVVATVGRPTHFGVTGVDTLHRHEFAVGRSLVGL